VEQEGASTVKTEEAVVELWSSPTPQPVTFPLLRKLNFEKTRGLTVNYWLRSWDNVRRAVSYLPPSYRTA